MTARSAPKGASRTSAAKLGQRQQYRVTWRRWAWADTTHDKSKLFGDYASATRFIRFSLHGTERPELSELMFVRLDSRPVGPWTVVEDW